MVRSFWKTSLQGSPPLPTGTVHRALVMGHSFNWPGSCPRLLAIPHPLVLLPTFSSTFLMHLVKVMKPTTPITLRAMKRALFSFAGGD